MTSLEQSKAGAVPGLAAVDVLQFEMTHNFFGGTPAQFTNLDAPDWLTSAKTVPGSTMDDRWFWREHVLTLKVGESVATDFQTIKRVG